MSKLLWSLCACSMLMFTLSSKHCCTQVHHKKATGMAVDSSSFLFFVNFSGPSNINTTLLPKRERTACVCASEHVISPQNWDLLRKKIAGKQETWSGLSHSVLLVSAPISTRALTPLSCSLNAVTMQMLLRANWPKLTYASHTTSSPQTVSFLLSQQGCLLS